MGLKLVKLNQEEEIKFPVGQIVEKVLDIDQKIADALGTEPIVSTIEEPPIFSFYTLGYNQDTNEEFGVIYSVDKTNEELSILINNYSITIDFVEYDIANTQYIPKEFTPLNNNERNIRLYMKKEAMKSVGMLKDIKDEISDLKFRVDLIVRWNMWLHMVLKEILGTNYTEKMPQHYQAIQEFTYVVLSSLNILRSDIENDPFSKVIQQMREEDRINHNMVVMLYVKEIKKYFTSPINLAYI